MQLEQGSLHIKRLSFAEAVFLLVGANVGAAILSLPYAARGAGYPGVIIVAVITTAFSLISHLYIVEIMLRTKRVQQLVGLLREHVFSGKSRAPYLWLVSGLTLGVAIPALTGYVLGGGAIIGAFLGVSPMYGALLFMIPGAFVVWLGLKSVGISQKVSSILMGGALLAFTLASVFHREFDPSRLSAFSPRFLAAVLPVGIYTSMSHAIVPEVARGLAHKPALIPKAIKVGLGLNLLFLILFPIAVFGLQPVSQISEVVTVSWGRALGGTIYVAVNLFALLALVTSFWGGAGALLGNVVEILQFRSEWDIKNRAIAFILTVTPSLLLVLFSNVSFLSMIEVAGSVGGVTLAVLPIFVLRRARAASDRTPEYTCGKLFAPIVQVAVFAFYVGVLVYAATAGVR